MDRHSISKCQKYKPIEVTTHNIYFHEDSPILSTDIYNNIVSTCGFDGVIRLWSVNFKEMSYRDNVYRTAGNSSIQIEYYKDLTGFSKPINCTRFYKGPHKSEFILASCSDGGKVVAFDDKNEYTIRRDDGDDAYELCWSEKYLIVGLGSGYIEIFQMIECDIHDENESNTEDQSKAIHLQFKLVLREKIHEGTIQGISYNQKYNLISTFSLDKTVKIHQMNNNNLNLISVLDQKIDSSRGLFKRILFEENLLYLFNKNNTVSVICYPFKNVHLQKKIGPLNCSAVKVLTFKIDDDFILAICTKKSVYLIQNDELICCIDNACYMAITDGFVLNNTIFLSSMDGFISTIRLSKNTKESAD